jgi:FkbM family methyltransferase
MPDFSFIDVGTNLGDWTFDFRNIERANFSLVILIEPIMEFFKMLTAKFLEDKRISVHGIALSSIENEAYSIAQVGRRGRRYLTYKSAKKVKWFTTEARSGDSIVKSSGIVPKVIKIDCDGDDFFVIKAFAQTISELKPTVRFEHFNPFVREAGVKLKDICIFFNLWNMKFFVLPENVT